MKVEKGVEDFLATYNGKALLGKHSLDEVGTWVVEGEDPNCDLGGYHSQPRLGRFHGSLLDVIATAVKLGGFWQWGAGGNITKVTGVDVTVDV